MPALRNARQELFCLKMVEGMSKTAAYEAAGYPRSSGNASTLSRKEHIKARIAELFEEKRERAHQEAKDDVEETTVPSFTTDGKGNLSMADYKLSEEWLVTRLMLNIELAQKDGKFREANTGIMMLGDYFGGLFSPKNPKDNRDPSKNGEGGGQGDPDKPEKPSLAEMMQRLAEINKAGDAEDDDKDE